MPCCCGGNGCNYPLSVTVTLALGAVSQASHPLYLNTIFGAGCCISTAEMQSAVNGTYILYPVENVPGRYELPGYLAVVWPCSSGNLLLAGDRCRRFYGEAQATNCGANNGNIYCVGRWTLGQTGISWTSDQTSYTFSRDGLSAKIIQRAFGTSFTQCPNSDSSEIWRSFAYSGTVTGNF